MTDHNLPAILEEARQRLNEGDLDGYIETLYAPDCHFHFFPPELPQGWEGARLFYQAFRAAFPDIQLTLDDVIVEGERLACRFHLEMTHQGDFNGIPPTGRRVTMTGITVIHFANGQAVERWSEADFLGLLQQLGAIPAPTAA